jgi:hypothetical protein
VSGEASVNVKNLDAPDRSWRFLEQSKRVVVHVGQVAIGRGVYRPAGAGLSTFSLYPASHQRNTSAIYFQVAWPCVPARASRSSASSATAQPRSRAGGRVRRGRTLPEGSKPQFSDAAAGRRAARSRGRRPARGKCYKHVVAGRAAVSPPGHRPAAARIPRVDAPLELSSRSTELPLQTLCACALVAEWSRRVGNARFV